MSSEALELICDGEFEIVNITEDLYDEAAELFRNNFLVHETVSIACNLNESPEVIAEMITLFKTILKDNISFAAREVKTRKLVGICANKLLNPSANITLEEVYNSFKTPNMKAVGEYLHTVEFSYDIFKEWQIESAVEMTFLSTRTEYGRRGIALALSKYFLDFAKRWKEGNCTAAEFAQIPEHLRSQRPQALMTVLTSRYSQAIAEKCNFETLFKEENTKFSYEGKTFAEKIDPVHKYSTFSVKRL